MQWDIYSASSQPPWWKNLPDILNHHAIMMRQEFFSEMGKKLYDSPTYFLKIRRKASRLQGFTCNPSRKMILTNAFWKQDVTSINWRDALIQRPVSSS